MVIVNVDRNGKKFNPAETAVNVKANKILTNELINLHNERKAKTA